jgi:hypothetical protein
METSKPCTRMRCTVCGTAIDFSPTELLTFTDSSWPRCCGEVMVMSETEEMPALTFDEHDTAEIEYAHG